MLLQTQSGVKEPNESEIIKLLQKLVKQRKESASILGAGGDDLAELEEAQIEVISQFLPEQLSSQQL